MNLFSMNYGKHKDPRQHVGYIVDESLWHRHPNGNGWVMNTATVAPTAFVGPEAVVADRARVLDNAKVGGLAVVKQDATVKDEAVVAGCAIVCGRAVVSQRAKVLDHANVSGDALVFTDSVVRHNTRLSKQSMVFSGTQTQVGQKTDSDYVRKRNKERFWGIPPRPTNPKRVSKFAEQPIASMTSGLTKYAKD